MSDHIIERDSLIKYVFENKQHKMQVFYRDELSLCYLPKDSRPLSIRHDSDTRIAFMEIGEERHKTLLSVFEFISNSSIFIINKIWDINKNFAITQSEMETIFLYFKKLKEAVKTDISVIINI